MSASPALTHGVDGWTLEDMDWDPETGIAQFTYEHPQLGESITYRHQPSLLRHSGWATHHAASN